MTKYIFLAVLIGFMAYWAAKGLARRFRGELPGRTSSKRTAQTKKRSTQQKPARPSRPPQPGPQPVRDARFRDLQ